MCLSCGRFWTALQILWSVVYVICGAAQLMAGIFFTISVPELHLYNILFAGSWNIVIGICGGMVACIGMLSSRRQEILLYMSISILTVNFVNLILMEFIFYRFYHMGVPQLPKTTSNHMLIDYGCFVTRIASAVALVVSFFDSQLTFCSMQSVAKVRGKKVRGSHEQVSDIEYIIPRPKNSKPTRGPDSRAVYDAYAQSWVFEGEEHAATTTTGTTTTTTGISSTAATPAACSNANTNGGGYFKIVQNGTTPKKTQSGANEKRAAATNGGIHNGVVKENGHFGDHRPLVHIESASDSSHSDRQLNHMKSFSRSQSPMVLSASSSQISLNNTSPQISQAHNPPIYECLERLTEPTIYRSRLNTALSNKEDEVIEPQYQAPQTVIMRRVEATSPRVEKVQYASLMKELQKAIVNKKEPPSITSPQSNNSDSAPASEKTQSSRSEGTSDVEFSKELEAALQLIQDLESPNTIETPSDAKCPPGHHPARTMTNWRASDASESSEKTLSAVGSLAELTSPLTECQPEMYTFKPTANGKGASVIVRYPDSQSTSGYSSPTHGPTPNWSTTSSINGSHTEIKPTSFSIHNTNSSTVISLYSSPNQTKTKQVTLVKIISDDSSTKISTNPNPDNVPVPKITKQPSLSSIDLKDKLSSFRAISLQPTSWKLNSLLRRKKQSTLPKLAPELEGAIIKSESLAYLSDLELLARHQRNQEVQREIEKRVVQQLGVPRTARTESNC